MNAGTSFCRTNSIAASVPRDVHTWVPSSTTGFSARTSRSASASMPAGSPMLLVDARYRPASGMPADSTGTELSRMSRGISRKDGPGAPL
jgi:hypothetical protein